jgi:hypothetical protein
MPRRTIFISQLYLSPTRRAAAERTSPAALAQFRRQVQDHNIPYWGPNCVVQVLNSADGEFQDASIAALLILPAVPFCVSYPVLTLVQIDAHDCIYCPFINYSEDSGNPPYEFHLESAAESQPSSEAKSSSSFSVAESQSSRRISASPPSAKLQPSSRYNYHSNNTSNPQSLGLDNLQSDRSSNRSSSDSYIDGPSNDLSNPHSPGLDPWQSNGPSGKVKEAAQVSKILRQMMARSFKAGAAAAQAAKDRQFRAFQEKLGLSLDNDGKALALSAPQKAVAQLPVA